MTMQHLWLMALSSNADVGAASSTRFKVHSVFAPTEAQKRKQRWRCSIYKRWVIQRLFKNKEPNVYKIGAIWPIKDVTSMLPNTSTLEVKLNVLCKSPLWTWQIIGGRKLWKTCLSAWRALSFRFLGETFYSHESVWVYAHFPVIIKF